MKKKIIVFLLTGSMLLQCTYGVMAAEIINEDAPAVIAEEQEPDAGKEQVEEVSLYGADVHEENVGDIPLFDNEIQWASDDSTYWDNIDWGNVQWNILSGGDTQIFGKLPPGWAEKVKWDEVDWEDIYWDGYSKDAVHKGYWEEIHWDKVNWGKMFWRHVNWKALKGLVDGKKISLSFTYKGVEGGKLTTPVFQIPNTGYWSIQSSCVTIGIKGTNATKYEEIQPEAYTIIVEQSNENYTLKGVWNVAMGDRYGSSDFFELDAGRPLIVHGAVRYSLANSEYWTITVDDSNCTFADTMVSLPKVTIKSKDGVVLEEEADYTIEDVTETGEYACGEHTLKITAVKESEKVAEGSVERSFTVHYADIENYYTLSGVPDKITVRDVEPLKLVSDVNGADYPKDTLKDRVHLEPKNNDQLKKGRLPRIFPKNLQDESDLMYETELFNINGFLKVEYGYYSKQFGGFIWSETFQWDDWKREPLADNLHIKVSVNDTVEGGYPQVGNNVDFRYLKGSIRASMRVVPYSLKEKYSDKMPKTEPTLNGMYYLAVVNPETVAFDDLDNRIPDHLFESIREKPINSVTYNGMGHTPDIEWSVYDYGYKDVDFGAQTTRAYEVYQTKGDQYDGKITYKENINAGKGKVEISFSGEFTDSITRYFTIEPKSIADEHVKIQAQDFLYDGDPHTPILSVIDTAINNKELRKDIDYTVTTTSNTTSPGTVTATITGIKNYKGTRTVQYKIVSTSVTVIGTKLEQVANISDKIEDQKYTGQPVTPEVVITGKNPSMKLVKDRDYKVSYLNNIESGTAYAVVEGIGNYGGTYIIPFVIGERLSQKIVVLPAQERDLKKRTLFSKPTVVKYTESPKTDTTYTSSDPNIVKVDAKTGAIEYKGIGTAVITINAAASDVYNAAIKELTVKVLPRTPKDVAVRFVAGKGIAVTGSAVPEASKYQLRIQKSGHKSVFVNIANIGALDTAYQTKSKGKFNVWVRAYKTVNGVEHFSGWTSKRTVIVR